MAVPVPKHRALWAGVVLVVIGAVTFWPALQCQFVRYDDDKYVTDNPHVRGGLSWANLVWAFTGAHFHMWHPLTTLSYLLDYELFGLKSFGYHLHNLILHLVNTVVLFWVLHRMTGALGASFLVAAVFAVHPLQVESVAWISERKNLLSGLFWLLTVAAYHEYVRGGGLGRYLLVLAVLSLGLMSKPVLVVVPFVLLLLDFWPLGGAGAVCGGKASGRTGRGWSGRDVAVWRLIVEKLPLVAPAVAVGIVTYLVQRQGAVVSTLERLPVSARLANAVISYGKYLQKFCWPSGLAVFYPHPGQGFSRAALVGWTVVLVVISAAVAWMRRRRWLVVGWLWYLVTLLPVIGLIQAGAQARADRYMYMPMIGVLIGVVWLGREVFDRVRVSRAVLVVLAGVVVVGFAVKSRQQLQYWRDSISLFERALAVTENNYVMHNNYANLLQSLGRTDEAIAHYQQCIRLQPDSPAVYVNLGNALQGKGLAEQAIEQYRKAIELVGSRTRGRYRKILAEAHYNLADALRLQGRSQQALDHYLKADELRPGDVDTLRGLGLVLAAMGRVDEAIDCYRRILQLQPDHIVAHGLLGLALAKKGRLEQAAEQFRIVLRAVPDDVEMHCNLGVVLQRQRKIEQALACYRRALELDPDNARARKLLEAASEQGGSSQPGRR